MSSKYQRVGGYMSSVDLPDFLELSCFQVPFQKNYEDLIFFLPASRVHWGSGSFTFPCNSSIPLFLKFLLEYSFDFTFHNATCFLCVSEIHHNFPFPVLNGTRITHLGYNRTSLSLKELLQMLPPRDLSMYGGWRCSYLSMNQARSANKNQASSDTSPIRWSNLTWHDRHTLKHRVVKRVSQHVWPRKTPLRRWKCLPPETLQGITVTSILSFVMVKFA